MTSTPLRTSRPDWPVPLALVGLSVIPLVAGSLRLVQLVGGPDLMPADERFAAVPVALVVHILGAAAYATLGALQLAPRFRRRHLTWHRRAGRVLVVAALAVAGSALWMTVFYDPKPGTGTILLTMRLVLGAAMASSIVLGVRAIRRGDVTSHRAWMIRAYAIALAAGTQVFTEGVSQAVLGSGVLRDDLAKTAGWAINLAVAEWIVRHEPRRHPGGSPLETP